MECTGLILRLVIVLVLFLTLIILTSVLAVVWSMPDIPKVYPKDLCIAFKGDSKVTCYANSLETYAHEKVQEYYESLVNDYNRDEADADIISLKNYIRSHHDNLRPVARLTGDHNTPQDIQTGDDTKKESKIKHGKPSLVPVRKWTNIRELQYTGGIRRFGVSIHNGRIIVPVAGDYAVYSFIHFREPCIDGVPQVEDPNIQVKQSIFKFDILEGRDEEMVSTCHPHKISQNYYVNMYGSFLSSVLRLKAGDELSVKVSNITYLEIPTYNYFGAHLI